MIQISRVSRRLGPGGGGGGAAVGGPGAGGGGAAVGIYSKYTGLFFNRVAM